MTISSAFTDFSSLLFFSHKRNVFVATEAGKPVYSRYGNIEALSSFFASFSALVKFSRKEHSPLFYIATDTTKIVFLEKQYFNLLCISNLHDSFASMRNLVCCTFLLQNLSLYCPHFNFQASLKSISQITIICIQVIIIIFHYFSFIIY